MAQDVISELSVRDTGEGFSELLQYLKNENAGSQRSVVAWLKTQLLHGASKPGGAHKLLLELPCQEFITTNYDTHLLDASRDVDSYTLIPIDDPGSYEATLDDIKNGDRKAVLVRLHGAFENEATIVATTDDYINVYTRRDRERKKWPDILHEMFRRRRVVFLGYSMRDFTTWTSYLTAFSTWSENMLPHVIVAPTESTHLKTFWSNYGIKYISLKAHQFLIAVQDYLGNLESQEHISVAAAAACMGNTERGIFPHLEEIKREFDYPTLLLAALKVVESSYD